MMNKPTFSSILDRPGSTIEQPKPLPIGTYLITVAGLPRYDKSSKKGTDFVEFTLQLVAPQDDVDPEAFEESGGLFNRDETPRVIKDTFYITEDAAWRLKKFLEDLGFDFSDEELTLREAAENSANRECYILIGHETSEDGTRTFARVTDSAAV